MLSMSKWVFAGVCLFGVFGFTQLQAQEGKKRPEVWLGPPSAYIDDNGQRVWKYQAIRDLFDNPDGWKEVRTRVDVLLVVPWIVDKYFTDDELKTYAKELDQWGLKVGFEVGSVKPQQQSGAKSYEYVSKQVDRFIKCGWKVNALCMDEPLVCSRYDIKKSDAYCVEQVATYVELMRKRYPEMRIGDIEPWAACIKANADDLLGYVDALQAKLKASHTRGLDFFRLDLNPLPSSGTSWVEVRKLQDGLRARKIPFSLIYIGLHPVQMIPYHLQDDYIEFEGSMARGYLGRMFGIEPDQYVIQDWSDVPRRIVPDNAEWSFTHTALEFCKEFLPDHLRKQE